MINPLKVDEKKYRILLDDYLKIQGVQSSPPLLETLASDLPFQCVVTSSMSTAFAHGLRPDGAINGLWPIPDEQIIPYDNSGDAPCDLYGAYSGNPADVLFAIEAGHSRYSLYTAGYNTQVPQGQYDCAMMHQGNVGILECGGAVVALPSKHIVPFIPRQWFGTNGILLASWSGFAERAEDVFHLHIVTHVYVFGDAAVPNFRKASSRSSFFCNRAGSEMLVPCKVIDDGGNVATATFDTVSSKTEFVAFVEYAWRGASSITAFRADTDPAIYSWADYQTWQAARGATPVSWESMGQVSAPTAVCVTSARICTVNIPVRYSPSAAPAVLDRASYEQSSPMVSWSSPDVCLTCPVISVAATSDCYGCIDMDMVSDIDMSLPDLGDAACPSGTGSTVTIAIAGVAFDLRRDINGTHVCMKNGAVWEVTKNYMIYRVSVAGTPAKYSVQVIDILSGTPVDQFISTPPGASPGHPCANTIDVTYTAPSGWWGMGQTYHWGGGTAAVICGGDTPFVDLLDSDVIHLTDIGTIKCTTGASFPVTEAFLFNYPGNSNGYTWEALYVSGGFRKVGAVIPEGSVHYGIVRSGPCLAVTIRIKEGGALYTVFKGDIWNFDVLHSNAADYCGDVYPGESSAARYAGGQLTLSKTDSLSVYMSYSICDSSHANSIQSVRGLLTATLYPVGEGDWAGESSAYDEHELTTDVFLGLRDPLDVALTLYSDAAPAFTCGYIGTSQLSGSIVGPFKPPYSYQHMAYVVDLSNLFNYGSVLSYAGTIATP